MLATSAISVGYSLKPCNSRSCAKKRMYSMAAFMHHSGDIIHLAGSIHKNKWGSAFSQRAIISSRGFPFRLSRSRCPISFIFLRQSPKKDLNSSKQAIVFSSQLFSCFKRTQRLYTCGLCLYIPWT